VERRAMRSNGGRRLSEAALCPSGGRVMVPENMRD